jgi:hypothetical protein
MTEGLITNETMFDQYCGKHVGRKICVTTTHWDRVDEEIGAQRETEIRDKYRATGATMARFQRTHTSAWEVVETLLQASCPDLDADIVSPIIHFALQRSK